MASSPITSQQIDGEKVETVPDFYFLGLQNHCGVSDCCHEIKRRLLLGKKAMTNLESILKSKDIILPNLGIKPRSPALQVDSLLAEPQGKPS